MGETQIVSTQTGNGDVELPGGWRMIAIGQLARTSSGGTPKRDTKGFYGGSIPWVKSGELKDSIVLRTEETITEAALRESAARVYPKGTLLLAMYGATAGKVAILGIDAAINQAICAISPGAEAASEYLFFALIARRTSLLGERFGGAQPNLSQTVIGRFQLLLPPLNEQRAIARVLRTIQRAKEATEKVIAATRELKKSLMRSLFAYGFGSLTSSGFKEVIANELGTFPTNWPFRQLSELCDEGNASILTGPFGSALHASDYGIEGTPVVMPRDIIDSKVNDTHIARVKNSEIERLSKYLLAFGDVVLARRGELGRRAVVSREQAGWLCGTGSLRLRFDVNRVWPWFVS